MVKPAARRGQDYTSVDQLPCFVFHAQDFGQRFETVSAAREHLAGEDGWLIVLSEGSGGIHRPEDDWDAETLLLG